MSLYVRKGSPYWWMDLVPPDGSKRIQRSTKIRHDAPTPDLRRENRRLAEKVYHEAYTAAIRRREGIDEPVQSTETFAGFAAWYAKNVSAHKRGKARELEILDTLGDRFGPLRLRDITKLLVQEWMTVRRQQVEASTVNRETDLLKSVLAAAVPTHLPASPIVGLKRLRTTKRATAVLSREDEKKLAAAMTPADQAILMAALDTLIRAGDLMQLEWKHDHGSHLEVLNPKTGESYTTPVSKRLRKALNRLKRQSKGKGYIFAHRRVGKLSRTWTHSLKQMLEDACRRAGVTYGRANHGITFHGLRHTGTTRMILAGVPLRVVQAIGGWLNIQQLIRYAHPEAAMQDAVELVSRPVSHRRAVGGGSRRP